MGNPPDQLSCLFTHVCIPVMLPHTRHSQTFPNQTTPAQHVPTRGLANILSSLVAVSARVYSRALSKGCRAGSRFRKTLTTSPLHSLVKASSDRLSVLIFMVVALWWRVFDGWDDGLMMSI